MDVFQSVLRIVYVLIFFIAVFISLKFEMGEENKDERGKSISNKAYGIVFPLIPFGWFLIELYDHFIRPLDYDTYKLVIWFLISGLMILHGIIISVLKRIY
ncbi:hypothetical protein MHZ92_15830 [Sporosarcina sp. ACRSL]|uniref:hypothetical protein n=1 Tax=Sporosarcina sp. ACRSL TaxID=2918215 RepID=UPI001EF680EB|nr:hypothetical protein [Sporosarcina sp. ACRSL]MCG7345603.1 hypothetical protein [Sporosarcina sp. ACRSL]